MVTNVQAESFSPHNVLGMSTQAVYLTDPMGRPSETSTDEPLNPSENGQPTSDENTDTNNEGHDWKKRYADLKSYTDKKMASFESSLNDLKTQNSDLSSKYQEVQISKKTMPKTPEEFEEFKGRYPDLAAMIETAAMMVSGDQSKLVEAKLKQIEQANAQIQGERGWEELKKYHPDVESIKNDPMFGMWLEEQTPEVKSLIRSPNPKTIAKGLDLYKKDAGIKTPDQKAEERKNNTRAPQTPQRVEMNSGAKRTYTELEILKMSEAEFLKHKDDIVAAQYEGRISKR